jgi:hypothetical protein
MGHSRMCRSGAFQKRWVFVYCFPPIAKCAMDGAPSVVSERCFSKAAGVCVLLPTHRKVRDGWGTLGCVGVVLFKSGGCLRTASHSSQNARWMGHPRLCRSGAFQKRRVFAYCFPPIAKCAMDGAPSVVSERCFSKAAGVCVLLPTHRKVRDGWGTELGGANDKNAEALVWAPPQGWFSMEVGLYRFNAVSSHELSPWIG